MKKISFSELKNNKLARSMLLSTLCKPLGMVISFLYTPVLLAYLGEEAYGIWTTILSVINWINYFDVGLGQGLRNSLARYIALGDDNSAKQAASTGYAALAVISGVTFLIGTALVLVLDLGVVFNTAINVRPVMLVSFSCICINFVLSLSKSLLFATHQAEKVGFMTVAMQVINLVGIYVLSLFTQGSLVGVAIIIGFSGIVVNLFYTGGVWKKYGYLIPQFKYFRREELKSICNVGIKFFFIQIAALILYSTDNMIITQLFGPALVTPYHTSYTAFGIVNGLFAAMIAPLWSKYTVALEKNDVQWIKKSVLSLDKMLPLIGVLLLVGTIVFEPVSRIWLHKELAYEPGLVACMAAYYFLMIWGSIYATVLNGMGRVDLQLILGVTTAMLNIPLSIFFGKNCGLGTTGVCLATVLCMLISNSVITVNTHRYLNCLQRMSAEAKV